MFSTEYFVCHKNWTDHLLQNLKSLAAQQRQLDDISLGPILTWTNTQINEHIDALQAILSSKLLFGGKPIGSHSIPDCYGAFEATAVQVSLSALTSDHFDLVT